MKSLALSVAIFVFIINAHSQTNIIINKIIVSNVNPNIRDNEIIEGEEDGPQIFVSFVLSNDSKELVYLYPSETEINLLFTYSGKNYLNKIKAIPFLFGKNRILSSKEFIVVEFYDYLLLGTDLWSKDISDYRSILLELLPTLRIEYKDPNFNCYSTQIKNVVIYNTLH
ncbi:MAG: hypothetical protein JXA53_08485 [Bacteroidales bacterium]|nr:hypothetical protein [Bacteroidales bacterium]